MPQKKTNEMTPEMRLAARYLRQKLAGRFGLRSSLKGVLSGAMAESRKRVRYEDALQQEMSNFVLMSSIKTSVTDTGWIVRGLMGGREQTLLSASYHLQPESVYFDVVLRTVEGKLLAEGDNVYYRDIIKANWDENQFTQFVTVLIQRLVNKHWR